jgi:NADH:ubiquinone oxidoreductase subunit 6 (subunit J)
MVLDNKPNVLLSFEVVVWIVCTALSIGTYYYKVDIGFVGIITWLVFIGGIAYCILKAIDNLMR